MGCELVPCPPGLISRRFRVAGRRCNRQRRNVLDRMVAAMLAATTLAPVSRLVTLRRFGYQPSRKVIPCWSGLLLRSGNRFITSSNGWTRSRYRFISKRRSSKWIWSMDSSTVSSGTLRMQSHLGWAPQQRRPHRLQKMREMMRCIAPSGVISQARLVGVDCLGRSWDVMQRPSSRRWILSVMSRSFLRHRLSYSTTSQPRSMWVSKSRSLPPRLIRPMAAIQAPTITFSTCRQASSSAGCST